MNISEIKIRLVNQAEGKLKAVASIIFDGCFVVHDIKIIENKTNEIFISMPSKKINDGTYKDIAHPINVEMRNLLTLKILQAYREELAKTN